MKESIKVFIYTLVLRQGGRAKKKPLEQVWMKNFKNSVAQASEDFAIE